MHQFFKISSGTSCTINLYQMTSLFCFTVGPKTFKARLFLEKHSWPHQPNKSLTFWIVLSRNYCLKISPREPSIDFERMGRFLSEYFEFGRFLLLQSPNQLEEHAFTHEGET